MAREGLTDQGLVGWPLQPRSFRAGEKEKARGLWQEDVFFKAWGVTCLTKVVRSQALDGSWRRTREVMHKLSPLFNGSLLKIGEPLKAFYWQLRLINPGRNKSQRPTTPEAFSGNM